MYGNCSSTATANHRAIDGQPVCQVEGQFQARIRREERLRNIESPRSAVVESAFEPLRRRRVRGHLRQVHQESGQPAHALGTHRVPLVRHRRRTDLIGLERLVNLLPMGEESQIRAPLVQALSEPGQGIENETESTFRE